MELPSQHGPISQRQAPWDPSAPGSHCSLSAEGSESQVSGLAGCLHWGLAGVSQRETREVPSTRAWGTLTLKLRKREVVAPGFQGGRAGGH